MARKTAIGLGVLRLGLGVNTVSILQTLMINTKHVLKG